MASLRGTARALYVVAFLALGWCALTFLEAGLYDALQGRRLRQAIRENPRTDQPPAQKKLILARATRIEALSTGLVGRIEIERVGLSAVVAEGEEESTLRRAVGHIPGTAFPGEAGNVALAGHRETHFRALKNVRRDDTIRLTTPDGTFEYVVDSTQVVKPDRIDLLQPGSTPALTLITCYPFQYIGHAPERFIVQARQVGWVRH